MIEDNQIEAAAMAAGWFLNTIVYALTLRVTGNRFKAVLLTAQDRVRFVVSLAQGLNITTASEITHCINARAANA